MADMVTIKALKDFRVGKDGARHEEGSKVRFGRERAEQLEKAGLAEIVSEDSEEEGENG